MKALVQMLGRNKLADEELYDNTSGYDDEVGVQIAAGLTSEERKQAATLYHLFNELWGLCIVVGDPGMGKDFFGNVIAYKIKRYFPWKRILRDEKPRPLFGAYGGLFNENVLAEDLTRMRMLASGVGAVAKGEVLERAADDWVTNKGQVMLKNSLLYLTEFWRYCYRRDPHNPMNKTMGGIHKEKRHLDVLVVGTVQLVEELDRFTCLPWVDWKVTCVRSSVNTTGFTYFVQKVKYDKRMDKLIPIGTPFPMSFDGGKPRTYLGDGKIIIRKPNYQPETEEERIVLTVLKAGVTTYEELIDVITTHGDMTDAEILVTLKELKFRKRKRVIDYPCLFAIYNSKSAPQMRTTLKVED